MDKKEGFEKSLFYSYLIKANLKDALSYLKQYPERGEQYSKYDLLFEKETYLKYDVDDDLNGILLIYQKYYREVFYLEENENIAEEKMLIRFLKFFDIENRDIGLDEIEEEYVAKAFKKQSMEFLGGRTGGYYGPYIWRDTEVKKYEVELPEGIQDYVVKVLDGFLSKSWLDYLSFGSVGTGGWTDRDGIINCVKESYDFTSENFLVSLLKHEAQHVMDLKNYPEMTSEELEYRAKLVELIYSKERNLLKQFASEADTSKVKNGHSLAASRIVEAFEKKYNKDITSCSLEDIQKISKTLFMESNEDMER